MRKRLSVVFSVLVALAANALTLTPPERNQGQSLGPTDVAREVVTAVDSTLVTAPHNAAWKRMREAVLRATDSQQLDQAIRAWLAKVPDPNTRLLDVADFHSLQAEFNRESASTGIIDAAINRVGRHFFVVTPIVGSSAYRVGVRAGDEIVAVQGVRIGSDRPALMAALRGAAGTKVLVTLRRNRRMLTVELTRDLNGLAPVIAQVRTAGELRYGYIEINQFSVNTASLVRTAVEMCLEDHVTGFLLDLRDNPGGLVRAATEVSSMFLGRVDQGFTRRKGGYQDRLTSDHDALTSMPLVVLVNRGTASAAEILAIALHDRHRGVTVGERTFGQGYIFNLQPLADGSVLVLASSEVLGVAGKKIEGVGVPPDVRVASPSAQSLPSVNVADDAQYARGVQQLTRLVMPPA